MAIKKESKKIKKEKAIKELRKKGGIKVDNEKERLLLRQKFLLDLVETLEENRFPVSSNISVELEQIKVKLI